jgi:type IV secretory pathway VirB2 component (pilin)
MSTFERLSYRATMATLAFASTVTGAFAQFAGSVPDIGTPNPGGGDIRTAILNVLKFVLTFLALLAIIFIVVAGIRLIVSQGEEEQKEKAKKTILYVIIGLIVILFARVIVGFFTCTGTQCAFV